MPVVKGRIQPVAVTVGGHDVDTAVVLVLFTVEPIAVRLIVLDIPVGGIHDQKFAGRIFQASDLDAAYLRNLPARAVLIVPAVGVLYVGVSAVTLGSDLVQRDRCLRTQKAAAPVFRRVGVIGDPDRSEVRPVAGPALDVDTVVT